MSWEQRAAALADEVTHRGSRWRGPVAQTPRHVLVPKWWDSRDQDWTLTDGPASEEEWIRAAYSDTTLVTEVGGLHADHAMPGDHPDGPATSSSTMPGLAVRMLRHAQVYDGCDILDVATGSGYSAAVLCKRLGDGHVTSVDVNPYLTTIAEERLAGIGHAPKVFPADATGPLPGTYDRIVAMAGFRPVPASWLAALRPGGRLVTVIDRTALILTADKTEGGDWAATGRIEWDRAVFMPARPGGYSGEAHARSVREEVDAQAGGRTTTGRYPVVKVKDAWELMSVLEVSAPGIEHAYREDNDGRRTAWMIQPDGSWARATGEDPPWNTTPPKSPRGVLGGSGTSSMTCAATGSATATFSSTAQRLSSSTTGPSVFAAGSGAARSRPTARGLVPAAAAGDLIPGRRCAWRPGAVAAPSRRAP